MSSEIEKRNRGPAHGNTVVKNYGIYMNCAAPVGAPVQLSATG